MQPVTSQPQPTRVLAELAGEPELERSPVRVPVLLLLVLVLVAVVGVGLALMAVMGVL